MDRVRRLMASSVLALVAACSSGAQPQASVDAGPAAPPIGEVPDSGAGAESEAAAPPPKTTQGKGGVACERRDPLGDGQVMCVAKVASLEVKLVEPPAGGSGPLRLGLYLHGDGAGAHKSGSALRTMAAWGAARRGLVVSVLAPNGCAWWQTPSHDCAAARSEPDASAENTRALARVVEALGAAFDLREDRVFYYGSSGGSIFLTEQWLPLQGGRWPGVFALMCGGEATRRAFAWDTTEPSLRARARFAFTYGDQDFLAADIRRSIAALRALELDVSEKVVPGAQHCAFDAHAEAMAAWAAAE